MQPGRRGVPEPVQGVGQPELERGLEPYVLCLPRPFDRLLAGAQRLLRPARVLLDPGHLAQRPRQAGRFLE